MLTHLFTETDGGVVKKFSYDTETRKIVTTTTEDVQPHLDYSQRLANEPDYAKAGIAANMQHIAHVPDSVVLKWLVEDGFDAHKAHPDQILAQLRGNREYSKLLTTGGAF